LGDRNWSSTLLPLGLSLAGFGVACFFYWLADRKGEIYALGTPINKQTAPAQFWLFVFLICSPFVMLGLFFLYALFR